MNARPKILIVDDKAANLAALRALLKSVDAEVHEALNGNDALALTLDHEFALILLDVQMPGMDGYEVAELLTGKEGGQNIPIIFITAAYKDELHRIKGYDSGAVDFLEKPLDDTILLSKVKVFLDLYNRTAALAEANDALVRQADDLRRANDELQQFAYIVSHDLRSPLASVAGFIEEINESVGDVVKVWSDPNQMGKGRAAMALQESIPEAIEYMRTSVQRMNYQIDHLLKLSRAGKHNLEITTIDVAGLTEQVIDSFAFQISENNIELVIGETEDVSSDRMALTQILHNLMSNAIKFLDPERPGRIEVSVKATASEFVLRIADNGRGMRPEDIPKAFQIFQRLNREESIPGDGMGLAYVDALVRRMRGHIECESEPGVGTVFTVHLPKNDDQT